MVAIAQADREAFEREEHIGDANGDTDPRTAVLRYVRLQEPADQAAAMALALRSGLPPNIPMAGNAPGGITPDGSLVMGGMPPSGALMGGVTPGAAAMGVVPAGGGMIAGVPPRGGAPSSPQSELSSRAVPL
ncbi:hypothetical protein K431DRAFT_285652 [Polychaeton citri CBS 116435]|uniref:Uncharacterized protein n=1 Tax=Polychaeton citri CBS 116435 TaxID=1314669 RepID=A0A9P4Q682_9PEZI|nr:hypothetical protein K431DRAFT_285652 [Polychaeton citri CBS 116435]